LVALVTVLASAPTPAFATPLGQPASVTALPGRRSIAVSWTQPISAGGTIVRYRATATVDGNAAGTCDLPLPAGSLTCTITGLVASTAYTVGVVACPNALGNDGDCSAATTAAGTVTPGPPGTPSLPSVSLTAAPPRFG